MDWLCCCHELTVTGVIGVTGAGGDHDGVVWREWGWLGWTRRKRKVEIEECRRRRKFGFIFENMYTVCSGFGPIVLEWVQPLFIRSWNIVNYNSFGRSWAKLVGFVRFMWFFTCSVYFITAALHSFHSILISCTSKRYYTPVTTKRYSDYCSVPYRCFTADNATIFNCNNVEHLLTKLLIILMHIS